MVADVKQNRLSVAFHVVSWSRPGEGLLQQQVDPLVSVIASCLES
jgi:hypothetical protein